MITQQLLKQRYDYKDGQLIFKIKIGSQGKIGKIVGCKDSRGYIVTTIKRKQYNVHRLIWIWHNGDIVDGIEIDHINRIKSDNKIENLRLATTSQNQFNTIKSKDNTSGYKGVGWHKSENKWRARISINKKRIDLGHYSSAEEAHNAYMIAAKIYHKEFARC